MPIERADVDEPPFDEVIELGREGGMDVDVVEVKPCVATGQGANVMDSEAPPFIEVDGDATVRVDQLRRFVSEQVGAAAVDGERLIREGCHRSLRASAHIGQRESDPENVRGGHSQSGTRAEPPSSSGPEETLSCVRRGKPVVETVSTSVAVDQGGSEGSVDSGDAAMAELERALNLAYRDEMRDDDREFLQVIGQLGGSRHRYLRERRRAVKHIVSEIYSPPRVTAAAKLLPELRCVPGFALDLTVQNEQGLPWDFDLLENRQRARAMVEAEKPMLLIGSPMCTAFSAWQHLNKHRRDPTVITKEYTRAMIHIRFCMELYALQAAAGRYFVHEHPAQATSWAEEEVRRIANVEGVTIALGDQCQYGAADSLGNPLRKPTKFTTNSRCIGEALGKRCKGRGGDCSRPRGG